MSRIGREPITVPASVTVTVAAGNVVTIKGPLGELKQSFSPALTIAQEGATLTVTLLNNMVVGVTDGYTKKLEIVGVGYRAEKKGNQLVLGLGYSHPVIFEEANGVKFECPDSTTILVKGIDKQAVGQVAAVIRSKRPPEPYLGKGIKYTGEKIRRKAGKTGK